MNCTKLANCCKRSMSIPNPTSSNMRITLAIADARLQAAAGDHEAAQATLQAARTLQSQHPSPAWRDADLAAYEALFCLPTEEWERVGVCWTRRAMRTLAGAAGAGGDVVATWTAGFGRIPLEHPLESGIPFEPRNWRSACSWLRRCTPDINSIRHSRCLAKRCARRCLSASFGHLSITLRACCPYSPVCHTPTRFLSASAANRCTALQAAGQPVGRLSDLPPRPTLDSMARHRRLQNGSWRCCVWYETDALIRKSVEGWSSRQVRSKPISPTSTANWMFIIGHRPLLLLHSFQTILTASSAKASVIYGVSPARTLLICNISYNLTVDA